MIIEYKTKEIRDCVLRDLWLELSVGRFEKQIDKLEKNDVAIIVHFGGLELRVSDWSAKSIDINLYSSLKIYTVLETFYIACNIIDFLRAGAIK